MSSQNAKKRKKNIFPFGEKLQTLRSNHNISIEEFSKELGYNVETIKKYEKNERTPALRRLLRIASFYEISADFLIFSEDTEYIHSCKLIKLAQIIDTIDQVKRFQIESVANLLLNDIKKDEDFTFKKDIFDLTPDIHVNIKILRESQKVTQKMMAEYLDISQSVVASYEVKTKPPIDKLLKLSEYFETSIHNLISGEKLSYDFQDGQFGKTLILADKLLNIEDHKILIKLMEKTINQ